jgi:ribosome-associated translation inhibitor RaiA
MQFQLETDNHIQGRQALQQRVEASVRESLGHLGDSVTRVVAHLSEPSASRSSAGAPDFKCLFEAHVTGLKDLAVSHHAPSLAQAIDGAAGRLKHALQAAVDKREDAQRRGEGHGPRGVDVAPEQPGRA